MKCPYCQHPGPHQRAGVRLICGACGESFSAPAEAAQNVPETVLPAAVLAYRQRRHQSGVLSVRKTVIFSLCIAILGFLAGFAYRQLGRKAVLTETPQVETVVSHPPLKIPALRFLPNDADLAFALQLDAEWESAAGASLAGMLNEVGLPMATLEKLLKVLGTTKDNVRTVAGAARWAGVQGQPQIFVVLHWKDGVDIENANPEARTQATKDRQLLQLPKALGVLPIYVWQPVEKYAILALDAGDYESLPKTARDWEPSKALQEALSSRLTEDTSGWLIARTKQLPGGPLLATLLPKDVLAFLQELDGLTMTIRRAEPLKCGVWVDAKTEATASQWRGRAQAAFGKATERVQVGGAGVTCYLRFLIDAATYRWLRETLR
jgi:hypothetical protein